MKPDEKHVFATPMLRHLEKTGYVLKAAGAGKIRSDLVKCDRDNRINFDLALLHSIPLAHGNVRMLPNANTGSDGTRPDRVAQILYEQHDTSLERDTESIIRRSSPYACPSTRSAARRITFGHAVTCAAG